MYSNNYKYTDVTKSNLENWIGIHGYCLHKEVITSKSGVPYYVNMLICKDKWESSVLDDWDMSF
jgi:hypothetical protein